MGRARGIQQEAFRLFACLTSVAHQAFTGLMGLLLEYLSVENLVKSFS